LCFDAEDFVNDGATNGSCLEIWCSDLQKDRLIPWRVKQTERMGEGGVMDETTTISGGCLSEIEAFLYSWNVEDILRGASTKTKEALVSQSEVR
jgi:hypothetical protein